MNKSIESVLLSLTNSKEIIKTDLIQTLWSGYGQLKRITLDQKSVIVKNIKYPTNQDHPHGWSSDFSHLRKVRSYEVEFNWYKRSIPSEKAYFPSYISDETIEDEKYLILEDLKERNFTPKTTINFTQVQLCIEWLANFHAQNLGASQKGLWEVGTYWHLETRPQEFEVLKDQELKKYASAIDAKLSSSKFQTLVHGDAKLANFLFNDSEVSAVDFQYIGGGVGVKDLAYFLSSIYDENELIKNEEQCLQYYFSKLKNALDPEIEGEALEKDWRELYPYAWTDFYRFLQGWSPGHWKINSYSKSMKQKVLDEIK